MVCSRYFRPEDIPDGVIVETHELPSWMVGRGYVLRYEVCSMWLLHKSKYHPDRPAEVREQRLTRPIGDEWWCAGDVNPPWLHQVADTPFFATKTDAEAFLHERSAA